jgi:Sulfotransferase domain
MIVWVCSYPRSGNTFLRIVLRQLYGVRTSVVYDVDGVAERIGRELVGYTDRAATIQGMRASDEVHFVKTHRQRDGDVDEADRAICLVRDGRDAAVSWARLLSEADPSRFEPELRALIDRCDTVGTGSWGGNVLSWLVPSAPHRVTLRYEDLTARPKEAVAGVLATVAPRLRPLVDARIPSFDELRRCDGRFFRRGRTGSHRDEMPPEMQTLFWSHPDNATAMRLLGYQAAPDLRIIGQRRD